MHLHQQLPLAQHLEFLLGLLFRSLIVFLHSGSPLEIEFATRTLSEFGSRAAASSFRFQLKAGQLRCHNLLCLCRLSNAFARDNIVRVFPWPLSPAIIVRQSFCRMPSIEKLIGGAFSNSS